MGDILYQGQEAKNYDAFKTCGHRQDDAPIAELIHIISEGAGQRFWQWT